MDRVKLLRAVYEAIDWRKLYALLPDADRAQVDDLFGEMHDALGERAAEGDAGAPDAAAPAGDVSGGEAWLYTDGASKGNPGPAGIGMVIADADGRQVAAWGESIGRTTNNVAEYRAVIAGLTRALELGARSVCLVSDSELMVRQINGAYKVKNAGLKPLHAQAMALLGRFGSWRAEHAPREQNRQADSLADRYARKPRRS